jgi:archaemetzincin
VCILLILCLFSCGNETHSKRSYAGRKIVFNLQPFTDLKPDIVNKVKDSLSPFFPNLMLSSAIPLPESAFNPQRKRYRADTLLRYLRDSRLPDTITVGLTSHDISTTKNGIADWGVMGLGYRPGRACVISTFRLKKTNEWSSCLKWFYMKLDILWAYRIALFKRV